MSDQTLMSEPEEPAVEADADLAPADPSQEPAVAADANREPAVDADPNGEPAVEADADLEPAVEVEPAEDVPADPNDELLEALQIAPGEWYVVHSYAGYERRVKANIEEFVRREGRGAEDDLDGDHEAAEIHQIEVPMETVWEVKKGERKKVDRVKLPGYVLVRMEPSAATFSAIRHTAGVTGFVGQGGDPVPLGVSEVFEMLKGPERAAERDAGEKASGGGGRPAKTIEISEYHVGDVVTVVDGPFESLQATISEVNPEARRITAMVELFGRDTPVELRFDQIKPI